VSVVRSDVGLVVRCCSALNRWFLSFTGARCVFSQSIEGQRGRLGRGLGPAATVLGLVALLSCGLLACKVAEKTRGQATAQAAAAPWPAPVQKLLSEMTLAEKIGQLNQITGRAAATGPLTDRPEELELVRKGLVGSMLNMVSAERTRQMQEVAVRESRLGIPLLFAFDVVHGYKTIFPIPLAEAASFDLARIELGARIAATEAAAAGLHWTFAPMVDIGRDARWGRVMEGAGEDTYYGELVARARVKGFQGDDLSRPDTLLACAKHFAGYGASEAGRDYNTVDMSERTLRQVYLPPFQAAAEAGVATFMTSFNEIAGVPSTGNPFLTRQILRQDWGYEGLVVSDWGSVGEMANHGVAATLADTAATALKAGVDMDMESDAYVSHLESLVETGRVSEALIEEAAGRVLMAKYKAGLLDDPFRYADAAREKKVTLHPEHRKAARDMAKRSIVLLKNQGALLPLGDEHKTVAVIGPLANAPADMLGNWSAGGEPGPVVTYLEGIRQRAGQGVEVVHAQGVSIGGPVNEPGWSGAVIDRGPVTKDDDELIAEAIKVAQGADVVLAALGEAAYMSGEAKSRTEINLPGRQSDLLEALVETGTPVVLLVSSGRPLTLSWAAETVPAIVQTWFLGTEAGHALADVVFGDYNPSAKLPMSFPRRVGQLPLYYNEKATGRPNRGDGNLWVTRFMDVPNTPLYPFGFGLSYTNFAYADLEVDVSGVADKTQITVSFQLSNTGKRAGEEVAQLYLRDVVASVTRPVRELKRFAKVALQPGETQSVSWVLTPEDLAFWDASMNWVVEPGAFEVMVGASSADIHLRGGFELNQN